MQVAEVALTRGSAALVVACYLGCLLLESNLFNRARGHHEAGPRWFWTLGCGFCVLHVLFAFAFFHEWSHAQAWAHTARRTAEVTGISWGGGLVVNYGILVLWVGDVVAWWCRGERHHESGGYPRLWRWLLAVIVFSATVIFGPSYWRWGFAILGPVIGFFIVKRSISGTS